MDKPLTLQEFARMGGKALVAKYGKDYMKEIGKNAAKKRKAKNLAK